MKHVTTLAMIAAVGFMSGCSSDKNSELGRNPGGSTENLGEPAWKLTLKTNCLESDQDTCAGAHGFTVLADGRFQVGPGPQGQTLQGILNPTEFAAINDAVDKATGGIRPEIETGETCQPADISTGQSSDTIFLNIRGAKKELIRKNGTEFCFKAAGSAEAIALHHALKDLTLKHYPTVFPDQCIDAVQGLQDIFRQLGSCQTDSDCAYVDNVFGPIPNGDIQFVLTDNCTVAPALVVANRDALVQKQEHLIVAKQAAKSTCGEDFYRSSCTYVSGFQANIAPPTCHFGSCRVSPSIYR